NVTDATACDSYTWAVNGTTYTTSGTYTHVVGCHTETLNVVITPSSTNNTTIAACDTYTWPVNGTTYTTSGTYTFLNGCVTEVLDLTINPSPTIISAVGNDATCFGLNDGSIVISPSSLIPNQPLSNLSPGTYSITLTDGNGCQVVTNPIVISQPTAITINSTVQNVLCPGGTGSITLTPTGGTGALDVVWDGTINSTNLLNQPAGTYTAVVTDENNCTATASVTIGTTLATTPVTANNLTGTNELTCTVTSITYSATGGSGYIWTTPNGTLNGSTLTVTAPGSYSLAANDSNGCPVSQNITITQDITPPTSNIINTTAQTVLTCTTTSIPVTASGGVSYAWSGGLGSNAGVSITSGGTFTVTVTGANGCTATSSITITVDQTLPTAGITNNSPTNTLSCAQANVSLTATGGGTYVWSHGPTVAAVNITTGGNYTVTVTGANGCTASTSFFVDQIATPTISVNSETICQGNCVTLVANTNISGGTYLWSPGGMNTASVSVCPNSSTPYTVTYSIPGCNPITAIATVSVNLNPVINISGTTTLCSGSIGNLTANSSVPGTGDWHWYVGTTEIGTTQSVAVTPNVTTVFTATGTVNGCTGTANHTINVTPTPIVSVPGTGVCTGGTATVIATPDITGGTYNWSPGGQTTSSIVVTPTQTTTYTVVYTAAGCASAPTPTIVTVTEQPTVTLADIGVCEGFSNTFNAVPSVPGGTYTWSPDPTGYTGNDLSVSPTTNTVYTVVYTLNNCASDPVSATASLYPVPTVTVPDINICQGYVGTITATPSYTGGTYIWTPGNLTGQSIEVSPNENTSYTVVYSVYGCSAAPATSNVTVAPSPTVSFTVDVTEGCAPLTVKLTNTSAETVNSTWTFGNGAVVTSSGPVLSYTFQQDGCFDVALSAAGTNGCVTTLNQDDLVCVFPQPVASFTLSNDFITQEMPMVNVNNTSINATNYYWDFGNGVQLANIEEPGTVSYPGNLANEYTISLVARNQYGCVDSTYRVIKVNNDLIVWVPNTFIPDGDGVNDIFLPVMTSGFDESTYRFIIVNRWGEMVFDTTDPNQGWDGTWNGNKCQDGTYSYVIRFRSTVDRLNKEITGHVNLLR
ncbi:MAG: hypothetical protein RL264_1498, partial [Bacteroidota bacterium]